MTFQWPPIKLGAFYALIISWLHYKQAGIVRVKSVS